MHKFIKQLASIFGKLGFTEKAKNKELTASDWQAIHAAYLEEFGTELSADQAAYMEEQENARQDAERLRTVQAEHEAALSIVNQALSTVDNSSGNIDAQSTSAQDGQLVAGVHRLVAALDRVSNMTIPDAAQHVGGTTLPLNGPGHTAEFFGGMPHELYSMKHRFNRIAVNTAVAQTEPVDEMRDGQQFRSMLMTYSSLLSKRIDTLRMANVLNPTLLNEGVSIGIDPDGLGNQYLTRRMDLIIARLAKIKNVYDIFPRMFGVQDRVVMINAFFGEFSQAYQQGQVWKGNVDLKPEIGYVDDAMFKTLFNSMKDIERQYIGYLNKEGSDPIKLTMIEWAMLNISTKLIEEQNKRKIMGIYIKPEKGVAGHTMNAGTGIYYTLLRYYNEGKIALVDDPAYASYTSGSTMVECVVNMILKLSEEGVNDLDTYEVILNANHRAKWLAGVREIYGKDNDFSGPDGDTIPDHGNPIRWCPYMMQLPLIIIQQPGNLTCLELEAGEMHNVKFDSDMEEVKSWSTWKEGTSATFAGKPFPSKAERKDHGFEDQFIFMNRPSATIDADATTVTVQGDIRHYITSANAEATALTDITGAKKGAAYMIEVGDTSNATTIAKSGKFDSITAEFTPTKVGDYIMVILNSNGDKFLELERCVGGKRTINTDLQPNVPGGR